MNNSLRMYIFNSNSKLMQIILCLNLRDSFSSFNQLIKSLKIKINILDYSKVQAKYRHDQHLQKSVNISLHILI